MKRNNLSLLILLLATAIGSFSACQGDVEEWVNPDQSTSQPVTKAALVEKTVAMTEAGKFASFFQEGELGTIQKLTVSGPLDASDIDTIRYQMPKLEVLDMKEVELIESDKTYDAEDREEHYKLKKGVITKRMLQYFSSLVTLALPKDITEIEDYGIYHNQNLVSIEIPVTVKKVGAHAFESCANLQKVDLSNAETLGERVFESCGKLTKVTLSPDLQVIPDYAFQYCGSLADVPLPSSLVSIGVSAFRECDGLSAVVMPNTVTTLNKNAYESCSSLNEMNLSQEGTPEINSSAFAYSGLRSITIPETVTAVGGGILNGCSRLTSIFWECNRDVPNIIDLNSTSCLLYLSHDVKCPSTWKNVIEPGGVAQTIVLKNEKRYLCPKAFTANKISYTREFAMKTIPGKAAGWQTIILPFSVQTITDKDGNRLAPFMAEGDGIWKRFWLRELQADGTYKDVTAIEANKPYLIAMPNAEEYASEYCISGNVTFEADNVSLGETPEIVPTDGGAYSMYGTYDWVTGTRKVYALNLDNWSDGSVYYEKGSVFVPSLRDVAPFECYLQNNNPSASTRGFIGIVGSHASTRAGHPLGSKPSVTDM